jgi:hypothetical protein
VEWHGIQSLPNVNRCFCLFKGWGQRSCIWVRNDVSVNFLKIIFVFSRIWPAEFHTIDHTIGHCLGSFSLHKVNFSVYAYVSVIWHRVTVCESQSYDPEFSANSWSVLDRKICRMTSEPGHSPNNSADWKIYYRNTSVGYKVVWCSLNWMNWQCKNGLWNVPIGYCSSCITWQVFSFQHCYYSPVYGVCCPCIECGKHYILN